MASAGAVPAVASSSSCDHVALPATPCRAVNPYRGDATPSAGQQPSSRRRVARPSGVPSAGPRATHSSPPERGDSRRRASRRRPQQLRSCRSPRHPAPRPHLQYRDDATPSASEQLGSRPRVARPSGAPSVKRRATHSSPTRRGVYRRRASRRRQQPLRSCRSSRHSAPRSPLQYRGDATPSASERPSGRHRVARPP